MSIVKVIDKGYDDENALYDVMNYGASGEGCQLLDGAGVCDCNIEEAINNMMFIKKLYGKEDGRQLIQIIVSIYRYRKIQNCEEFKSKWQQDLIYAHMVAMEIEQLLLDMGFQSNVHLHEDTDYIHLHFVVNSVNFKTAKKICNTFDIGRKINTYMMKNYRNLQWKGQMKYGKR